MNTDAIAVRCRAWNTVSRSGVGSTADPKIVCLNERLRRSSQRGSLVPEGTESVPKDDMPGDCVSLPQRLAAVRTVSARRSGHGGSQLGNREPVALSWKRAELGPGGLARAVDRSRPRPWIGSYVSDHRSGGAGGRSRPAPAGGYPKIPGLKRLPGWTTWERCRSSRQARRPGRLYSRGHTEAQ